MRTGQAGEMNAPQIQKERGWGAVVLVITDLRVRKSLTISSVIWQTSERILAELSPHASPHFSEIVTREGFPPWMGAWLAGRKEGRS